MYADPDQINSQIIDIVNAGRPGLFDAVVDNTSATSDKRRSQGAVEAARRTFAYRIYSAIGKNPAHPYYAQLGTKVTLTRGQKIPPCYGEIGVPEIQRFSGDAWQPGEPADEGQIASWLQDTDGTHTDFMGEGAFAHDEERAGGASPISGYYDTTNGYLNFTGFACRVPMIRVPANDSLCEDMADDRLPIGLQATNVHGAVAMMMKEGDNLSRIATIYLNQAELELIRIQNGDTSSTLMEFARAVQRAQKVS